MKDACRWLSGFFLTALLLSATFKVQGQEICFTSNASNGFNEDAGYGSWQLESSANSGNFTFSSTDNGDGDGNSDGDIGNPAWGFFANSGATASGVRPFNDPLTSQDEFSVGFDNGFLGGGSAAGIGLRNGSGENLVEFFFSGGATEYVLNTGTGIVGTGIPFSDEGFQLKFTPSGSGMVEVVIESLGSGSTSTFNVDLISPSGGQTIQQFRVFNFNAGSGGSNNVYVNNLSLCRPDIDGDGFGATSGDCDDTNAAVNPGNSEILFNGLDDDCNAATLDFNSGIFESYVTFAGTAYNLNGNEASTNPDFEGAQISTDDCTAEFILDGGEVKTFKCPTGNGDITGAALFYRIYSAADAPGLFSSFDLNFGSNDDVNFGCQNQTWVTNAVDIDLFDGLPPGEYTIDIYTTADYTFDGGSGTHLDDNGGDFYTLNLTVEDEINPVALCQDITLELDENGEAILTASEVDNGSSDNCGIAELTLDQTIFNCTDLPGKDSDGITELFFSEYIEGSGNNKCLEIFNGIGADVDLEPNGYTVQIFSNGNTSASSTIALSGTVANGDVFVICNTSVTGSFASETDQSSGSISFNGDDAVALLKDGVIIDVIGQIGTDPGSSWSANGVSTVNLTLVRKAEIITGDSDGADSFDPSVEWTAFPQDDASNLGVHTVDLPPAAGASVTLTVKDFAGNLSTCNANIDLVDLAAPIAICQDVELALDENGEAVLTAEDVNNGSSDNCGIAELTVDRTNFSCADLPSESADGITELFFSEYIEGSSLNKCLEIYNGTGAAVDLGSYTIKIYTNGSNSASPVSLAGTVGNDDVFVICNSSADSDFSSEQDQSSGSINFNGDDAVALLKDDVIVDVIGQIGTDPGSSWSTDGVSTQNSTLVRKAEILGGDPDGSDAFDPSFEWTALPQDDASQLGSHTVNLPNPGGPTVTLTVTDLSGIQSTCVANIDVVDLTAPTALCQDVEITLNENGEGLLTLDDVNNGSFDNCGIAELTLGRTDFNCTDINSASEVFSVNLSVTDLVGNQSGCVANVTVVDLSTPTALCQDVEVTLDENGEAILTAADVDNGSSDNCGIADLTLDQNNFSCADLPDASSEGISELFFSEYIEGSGLNKCLEIFNGTGAAVDLGIYTLKIYANGSNSASPISLSGTVGNDDVFVICNSSATSDFSSEQDQSSGSINFNGNDAVALLKDDVVVDVIGQIGTDPGSSWSNGGVSTQNSTLVRKAEILSGDPDGTDAFHPSIEWTAFSEDDAFNLGSHSVGALSEVTLSVTDLSGNTSTCTSKVTVIDLETPLVACPSDISVNNDPGLCGAMVDFQAVTADNCGATVSYSTEPGSFFEVGTTEVTATATDLAGNTATCTFNVTVVDTEAPTITCPADITVDNDQGLCGATIDFAATATDNCGATVSYDIEPENFFNVGTTQVTATATDLAGNFTTCTFTVTVADTEAPLIVSCPENLSVNTDAGSCGAVVDFDISATDNCTAEITYSAEPGSFFDVGTTEVTASATDLAGNTATCTFNVTVVDTEAPTLTCPADITVDNDPGLCGATIEFAATATDNCGATVSYDIEPENFFNVGTTQVTATATDLAGNFTTCTFSVTVADTEAPLIVSCPENLSVNTDAGSCGSVVDFGVSATDNCTAEITYSAEPGSFFDVGTTEVTASATDLAGNTATCTFDVTVVDTEAPTLTCPADITVDNDPGLCGATIEFTATATDNCGATVSYDIEPENFFNVGTTQVTATATDLAGNFTTCTFTVTVADTEAPIIVSCPENLSVNTDAGSCGAVVDFGVSATDNCTAEITYSAEPGSFFDTGTTEVTATATDLAGNTATCTFDVTVTDTEAPEIDCSEINLSLDLTGFAELTAANLSDRFSDNCGISSSTIVSGQTVFGCDDEGSSFPIEIEVVDVAGNTNTCITTVNITVSSDEDGDGISDQCDFCFGDNANGDSDLDGICDVPISCPGFDELTDPDQECDFTSGFNSWWFSASNGDTYCLEGPFSGGTIYISNGSTVRLSGTGYLNVIVGWGGSLEILDGSDLTFNNLQVGWGSDGLVIYPGANVEYNGNFHTNGPVVNCGTFHTERFQVNFGGSVINSGTIEVGKSMSLIGDMENHGLISVEDDLTLNYVGELTNYCEIQVGDDFKVFRNVHNHAFINVADYTAVYFTGRVNLYDGAMHQTGSTLLYGRYVGNGSQSLVKVLDNTIAYWNGRIDGNIAYCDLDGFEAVFTNNLFINGAEDSCLLDIAVDDCNPEGHMGYMKNAIAGNKDKFDWNEIEELLADSESTETHSEPSELSVWPNPVRDYATLSYTTSSEGRVMIELYSSSGQHVSTLFEGVLEKGIPLLHEIDGRTLPNGIYMVRITEREAVITERFVIAN